MKKSIQLIVLVLLALVAVFNASRVHNKVYDKCAHEWSMNGKQSNMAEKRPVSGLWQALPVSGIVKLAL